MKPKQCPNCAEPNKTDSKFCAKCRMVLTYDAYTETLEEKQKKQFEIEKLNTKYEIGMKEMREQMDIKINQIISMIQQNPVLVNIKPKILAEKFDKVI